MDGLEINLKLKDQIKKIKINPIYLVKRKYIE